MCGERLLRWQLTNLRSQLTNLRYRNLILAICGPCAVSALCAGVTVCKKMADDDGEEESSCLFVVFELIGSQAIKYLFFDYRWDHEYRPGLEALLSIQAYR